MKPLMNSQWTKNDLKPTLIQCREYSNNHNSCIQEMLLMFQVSFDEDKEQSKMYVLKYCTAANG